MSKKIVSLLFLSGFALTACSSEEQTSTEEVIRPVKTHLVTAQKKTIERRYPAIVLPAQQAELSFRTSGQITDLSIKAGAEIKEDDVIAKLDTRDLESQVTALESQMEQARAQLDALTSGARAEDLASLKANIAAAEAQVNAARQQVSRTQQLFDKGIVAKAKLDGDISSLKVAEAQLESTRQELIKGETGGRQEDVAGQLASIRGIEANLNVAKDNLANATLRAPFDGIVARRDVDNFANIQAKQTIIVLQKLDQLELSFDIPGPDIARQDRKDLPTIIVHLDAIPGSEIVGEVEEFNTVANTATQTFTGKVKFDQPVGVIVLPGMTGQVTVLSKNLSGEQIDIPATAVASDPSGDTYVWVVANGVVTKRSVKTGEVGGNQISIVEGLEAGETVVTAGVSFLQDGMKIRINGSGE